jgi:hypothetical protein
LLFQAGKISTRSFSFVLQRNPIQTEGSMLILGPPDSNYFTGTIVWNKVVSTSGMLC